MQEVLSANPLPRGPLMAMITLVLVSLLGVATFRLSGQAVHESDAATVERRSLIFQDTADGGVAVVDASTGRVIDTVRGEAGFLRGALRALARERRKRELGGELPFELLARADGRLTLVDAATNERLDLESFGPTNAAVFARLLRAGR